MGKGTHAYHVKKYRQTGIKKWDDSNHRLPLPDSRVLYHL
jgi:hypothetical protein